MPWVAGLAQTSGYSLDELDRHARLFSAACAAFPGGPPDEAVEHVLRACAMVARLGNMHLGTLVYNVHNGFEAPFKARR